MPKFRFLRVQTHRAHKHVGTVLGEDKASSCSIRIKLRVIEKTFLMLPPESPASKADLEKSKNI